MKRFLLAIFFCISFCLGYSAERNITESDIVDGVLTVPQYTTLIIPAGDSIYVKSIKLDGWPKGVLRVNGTLTLLPNDSDIIDDPSIEISTTGKLIAYNRNVIFNWSGQQYTYFSNKGIITTYNNTGNKLSLKWTGYWDPAPGYNKNHYLDLGDGIIKTKDFDVYIQANGNELNIGTIEETNGDLSIDRNNGGASTTAESLIIDGNINLHNNALTINIYEYLYADEFDLSNTYTGDGGITINAKNGAEIFVKDFSLEGRKIKFKAENGGVISLCKNPTHGSDWGQYSSKLVTLSAGAVFNYIVSEYYKTDYSGNTIYTNPKSEGDVELENGVQWTSDTNKTFGYNDGKYGWDDFRRDWRDWYYGHRQEGYAYIVGTYSNQSECQSVYETKKMNLLPITLSLFEATREDSIVHFHWITDSEVNCDKYIIEASFNGKEWISVGEFVGSGTTSERTDYKEDIHFNNKFLSNNAFIYFRLHEVDYDGVSYYSDVVSIQLNSSQKKAVRCNILGQYSQSGAMIEVYNGELRFIKK